MRIGIDISQIIFQTGVSYYTRSLISEILKIDKENDYVLFGGSLRRIGELKSLLSEYDKIGKIKTRILPFPPVMADFFWNKLHILNVENFVGNLDVFHSSDWTQPPSKALKVTTIHDLIPIKYPETVRKDFVRKIVRTHLSRLYWVKKEVDLVIAVSNSTKKDIIEYLGIPESKIRVIYEAADPIFYRYSDEVIKQVKQKYKIYDDYFLVVGDDPRKNLDRVIQAYERVRPKTRVKLVIAKDGLIPEGRGIIHVQGFSRPELAALYSGARALIYASLYEGFGLPIIEAFACGCPVVTSNVSSMPEIAGGAAVLVDPNEVDSIVDGIKNALKNTQSLKRKGYKRAKDFSWEKTAQATINVYKELKYKQNDNRN